MTTDAQLGLDVETLTAPLPAWLVDGVPAPGLPPAGYRLRPAAEVVPVHDGDVIDLGDRRLHVVHLPGRSPGSIALHEALVASYLAGRPITLRRSQRQRQEAE